LNTHNRRAFERERNEHKIHSPKQSVENTTNHWNCTMIEQSNMTKMAGIDIESKGMYYRLIHRLSFFLQTLHHHTRNKHCISCDAKQNTMPSHLPFDTKQQHKTWQQQTSHSMKYRDKIKSESTDIESKNGFQTNKKMDDKVVIALVLGLIIGNRLIHHYHWSLGH